MSGENGHLYHFKSFRLDVEERRLLHHDHPVPLTPKAFDLLAVLVEHSGHLIEKDELLRTVWSDSFVEEANVARIIHTLRKVLGDDGNGNKFIETVPKKGYRFVAEVEECCAPSATIAVNGYFSQPAKNLVISRRIQSAPTAAAPLAPPSKKVEPPVEKLRGIPLILIFSAGFVSAILLLFFLLVEVEVTPVADLPRLKKKSIAVLPIKPVNAGSRSDTYETGFADSINHRLGTIKGIVVRPLSDTRKYAEIEYDPLIAGKEQQVDFVLASSYQLASEKIRITARLFNVTTGEIEETYQSEKDTTDIFVMQAAVASEIGSLLQTRLTTASDNSAAIPEARSPKP